MLPLSRRLKRADFDLIKTRPRKVFSSNGFSLRVVQFDFEPGRFGIVVPSSVSKKATDRNKIKRRIRAVVLKYIREFKGKYAAIVYAKKEALDLSFKNTEIDLLELFRKGKIL